MFIYVIVSTLSHVLFPYGCLVASANACPSDFGFGSATLSGTSLILRPRRDDRALVGFGA